MSLLLTKTAVAMFNLIFFFLILKKLWFRVCGYMTFPASHPLLSPFVLLSHQLWQAVCALHQHAD